MMRGYIAIIARDIRLCLLRGPEAVVTFFFFLAVVMLFPFLLGGDAALLARVAPGVIWVAAVLAALLSLDAVYQRDVEDGTLDALLMSALPVTGIIAAKMAAHWLLSGFLLLPAAFLAAVMLHVPVALAGSLLLSLFLGTVYVSLLGGFGAALVAGSRASGLLLAVIVLPLFIPMLVLGALAAEAALAALPVKPYLLLQAALLLAALPLAPWAAGAAVRLNMRS